MSKFKLILTLDYELNVNKAPDVMQDMIKPTEALLNICSSFDAKLTIMVEIGELWAFEKAENQGYARFIACDPAERIRDQLVRAVKHGHDVQLHLHPQWIGAKWVKGAWQLDYAKYRLTDLEYHEMVNVFRYGKEYLEKLLSPYCIDYSCIGFRAGNWVTQPSSRYLRALHEAGLKSDTSVFKGGYLNTNSVYIDYRKAYSNILPWVASWDDINNPGNHEGIIELPIYSERSSIFGMLSVRRLRSASQYVREDRKIAQEVKALTQRERCARGGLLNHLSRFFRVYPKKLDFCKLSWKEMVGMIENVHHRYAEDPMVDHVPIVMIGHSKELMSSADLRRFLEEVSTRYKDSISFSTYREFIQQYRLTAG